MPNEIVVALITLVGTIVTAFASIRVARIQKGEDVPQHRGSSVSGDYPHRNMDWTLIGWLTFTISCVLILVIALVILLSRGTSLPLLILYAVVGGIIGVIAAKLTETK